MSSSSLKKRICVGIIGSAGRGTDGYFLSSKLFLRMLEISYKICCKYSEHPETEIDLFSGGAAFADHVAVKLFLDKKVQGLTLYLPCDYEIGKDQCLIPFDKYKDREEKRPNGYDPSNPGPTMTKYHKQFSQKCQLNSLKELIEAKEAGAILNTETKGFKQRNTKVAESVQLLIAFTFGEGNVPKDGGTSDTWDKSTKAVRVHIPLKLLDMNTKIDKIEAYYPGKEDTITISLDANDQQPPPPLPSSLKPSLLSYFSRSEQK